MAPARILCRLSRLTRPTNATRIDMLQHQRFHVEAMAYQRDFFHGRLPNFPVTSLGRMRHGHYGKRIQNTYLVNLKDSICDAT